VSNNSKRQGTEVVQVYVRRVSDTSGLLKTLRGFSRVAVPAGKTVMATVALPYSAFEFYSDEQLSMAVEPGDFEVWYGNSSADRDLKKIRVMVK